MARTFDPEAAARWIADQHAARATYENLPADLAPATVEEAYAAQDALHRLWEPRLGPLAGRKIATTTKVMQALMGIDHPCGGGIFSACVHAAPATLNAADYTSLMLEFELAVRLSSDLPRNAEPWTRETVISAVGAVIPAFELIEDRRAVYKETRALSLICDNAWNAGIVLGRAAPRPAGNLDKIPGRLVITRASDRSEIEVKTGATDDPMGALAWVANLAASRGKPLKAGQVVITGSVIATLPAVRGHRYDFTLEGIGQASLTIG